MSLRLLERSLTFLLAALLVSTTCAQQPDAVTLDDGTVYQGTIVREQDGYIWIKVGTGKPKFLTPDMIAKYTDNEPKANQPDPDVIPLDVFLHEPYEIKAWDEGADITRAAVLSAEGMVGMQFAAKPLREAIPMLKEEGVELLVLRVHSGGGLGEEVSEIIQVLRSLPEHELELVTWVESAIGAASVVVLFVDQRVVMDGCHIGSMVWGFGTTPESYQSNKEWVSRLADEYGLMGEHPAITSLFTNEKMSYSVLNDGRVVIYDDLDGDVIYSDEQRIPVLRSNTAMLFSLCLGKANTTEELAANVLVDSNGIEWVGEKVEGFSYPVCKAEKHQIEYRNEIYKLESRFSEYMAKYQMELQNAQGVAVDRRGGFLRRAEGYLARIKRMLAINPNFGILYVGEEWVRQQEEIIRELRRG
ncbi:MAG: hypothetical protein Phyf2KO_27670 [Phycisphaerales bacterium]